MPLTVSYLIIYYIKAQYYSEILLTKASVCAILVPVFKCGTEMPARSDLIQAVFAKQRPDLLQNCILPKGRIFLLPF